MYVNKKNSIGCYSYILIGTREERGLENWGKAEESEDDLAFDLEETAHVYEIARVSRWLKKFECLRFIPIFPQYNPSELSLNTCRKQKGKSVWHLVYMNHLLVCNWPVCLLTPVITTGVTFRSRYVWSIYRTELKKKKN